MNILLWCIAAILAILNIWVGLANATLINIILGIILISILILNEHLKKF